MKVPVFTAPGTAWILENLSCGQLVTLLGIEGGYSKIQFGQRVGYVPSVFVRAQASATAVRDQQAVAQPSLPPPQPVPLVPAAPDVQPVLAPPPVQTSVVPGQPVTSARREGSGGKIPPSSKIYIQPLDGFETFIAAAIRKKQVPLIVVANRGEADYELQAASESRRATWARTIFLG